MKLLTLNRTLARRRLLAQQLEDRRMLAGPYAPAADEMGSSAIGKDDPAIVAWATAVVDYSAGPEVDAEFQTPLKSLGPAEGVSGEVVSLGRGGQITLAFETPIRDGLGDDFAVFENGFSDTFLELGFVEVSSDGENFIRFPNDSLTASAVGPFGAVDPTDIHNLAGKYRQGFGTPFDLEELVDPSGQLDRTNVTHVRLIDIVGDGNTTDTSGDAIFDPSPTTGSAGLDVDAVGVLHQSESSRDVIGFEDVGGTLSPQSAFNGPVVGGSMITGPFDDTVVVGEFGSEDLTFNNAYSIDFGSWNGWAYSNATNTTTAGFTNQFSSFSGGGAGGSSTFGIGFPDQGGFFELPSIKRAADDPRLFESLAVTNTTYAALSMRDGDSFAKKFGGTSGDDPDFLLLTVTGKDANDATIGTIDFYLADYRPSDNALDYIVDQWSEIDLSSIANARELELSISSSDVGPFGINTPAYVAVDDITLVTPALPVDLSKREVMESDGDDAVTVRISRADADTTSAITVNLAAVDSSIANVPTSVTISAGQSFVEFSIDVLDDSVVDGDQQIVVEATANGYVPSQRTLTILDDDADSLSLVVDQNFLNEASSMMATVTRNAADLSEPLTIQLLSADTALLSFDSTVIIAAGQASQMFAVSAVDDSFDRENVNVSLTAAAVDFVGAEVAFDVIDNDVPAILVEASQPRLSESDANPSVTFEDVGARLGPDSFYNGNDLAGGFTSAGLTFNNEFNSMFGSWSGWSYSNTDDTTTPGFGNQYSAFPGQGALGSDTYGIASAFTTPTITREESSAGFESIAVTNTTYAALSMMQGDDFAKQFGGVSGDDPDFFLLTIDGVDENDASIGTIDFYLADFRFADNSMDYIVDEWTTVDLSSIADARELRFSLSSSDVGTFGMNTPAYFAADNVTLDESGTVERTISVQRNTEDVSGDVLVQLGGSDPGELTLPMTVNIPDGQASVEVPLSVINDALVDGDQQVIITATATGFVAGSTSITVADDDAASLRITVLTSDVDEGSGAGRAVVHRNVLDTTASLSVDLSASVQDALSIDSPVVIPAGSRSIEFGFSTVDNELVEEDQTVVITASAVGFGSDESTVLVINDDVVPPSLSLSIDVVALGESDSAPTVMLEDIGATLANESFYNGADLAGGFRSGEAHFSNSFNPDFGSWGGWSASNSTDTTTPGFMNQYSSIAGAGAGGSASYAVASAFAGGTVPTITIQNPTSGQAIQSLMVTNTTYAALSMRDGDSFAKKFGGESGDDPDFFLLTIDGLDQSGQRVGSVEFYLADFRFEDNSQDYIVDSWSSVDVSSLTEATSLQFSLSSSDVGDFGMNTPAYFAVDDVVLSDNNPVVATGTVTRDDTDLSEPLLVSVTSSDPTEATVPRTVLIPVDAASATFSIHAVDDALVDGTQDVEIVVAASTHVNGMQNLAIADDDIEKLTLSVSADQVFESGDDQTADLVIHRNVADVESALIVSLEGSGLQLPETATIPAGSTAVVVQVSAIDNATRDGVRSVFIDGEAEGFAAGVAALTIHDDEVSGLVVVESDESTSVSEQLGTDTFTVALSVMPLGDVAIAVVPASDEIAIEQQRVSFTPQNWNQPQVVTVQGQPDLKIDGESLGVNLEVIVGESDALFAELASVSVSVSVEDYQPDLVSLRPDGMEAVLVEFSSGIEFQRSTIEGIRVVGNELTQGISINDLNQVIGPIHVDAAGGDDNVALFGTVFTSLSGGDGHDRLTLAMSEAVELVSLLRDRVTSFEELDITNEILLSVDTANLDSIARQDGTLQIRINGDQEIDFIGEGIQLDPIMVGHEFAQVLQFGDVRVHLLSGRPWQNLLSKYDVDQSGSVTVLDALVIVNRLAGLDTPDLVAISELSDFTGDYYDVTGDNRVSALDALRVINEVGRQRLVSESEWVAPRKDEDPTRFASRSDYFDHAIGQMF